MWSSLWAAFMLLSLAKEEATSASQVTPKNGTTTAEPLLIASTFIRPSNIPTSSGTDLNSTSKQTVPSAIAVNSATTNLTSPAIPASSGTNLNSTSKQTVPAAIAVNSATTNLTSPAIPASSGTNLNSTSKQTVHSAIAVNSATTNQTSPAIPASSGTNLNSTSKQTVPSAIAVNSATTNLTSPAIPASSGTNLNSTNKQTVPSAIAVNPATSNTTPSIVFPLVVTSGPPKGTGKVTQIETELSNVTVHTATTTARGQSNLPVISAATTAIPGAVIVVDTLFTTLPARSDETTSISVPSTSPNARQKPSNGNFAAHIGGSVRFRAKFKAPIHNVGKALTDRSDFTSDTVEVSQPATLEVTKKPLIRSIIKSVIQAGQERRQRILKSILNL